MLPTEDMESVAKIRPLQGTVPQPLFFLLYSSLCRQWMMVPAEHLEMPSPGARASLLSRELWLSFALQVSLGVNFHIKF